MRATRRFEAGALSIVVLFGTITAVVPMPRSREERVDAVFAQFERNRQPGCAVGVEEHGRAVLTRGYGFADLKRGTPVTRASVFDIGSVSKQITAAVVYLLVADHVISLQDGVRTWVPELTDLSEPYIHDPEEYGRPPQGYPRKIIGHKVARERALAAYKALKGS